MAIKNNSCIARLSQDHHLETLFCDRIENGLKENVSLERLRKYVSYFWVQHLKKHFIEEEQLLFKNIDDVFCTKGKEDHLFINQEIENVISGKGIGQHNFSRLIAIIHQHINFEERVLFPHLELLLPQEELKSIQEHLATSHLNSFKDDFTDKFWTDKKL
jgi:hemerythrin-like domain-containing protein|nr:hemerythrin domain-containing protein [uncultured Pedobacter sp.]